MNLNTITLEGNLTANPQLVHLSGGVTTAVAEAVVLVNRRTKDSDGEWSDAEPTRYRIKAFNTLAQNIAALPKGARVLVVGHTETDTWTAKPAATNEPPTSSSSTPSAPPCATTPSPSDPKPPAQKGTRK